MDKDEMIKEMQKDLIMAEQDCVWLYEKEGYRKVADDEIVVKKSEIGLLKKTINYLEMEKDQLSKQLEQTKQEKRDILQAINKYLVGTRGIYTIRTFRNCRFEDIMLVRADDLETLVKKLAEEHGVELED